MKPQEIFDDQFLARLQQLHLIAKRLTARSGAGRRPSRRLGDGLEFADHRDYAAGDDIRFVDWPYFARMDKLLLRLFHEHSEGAVSIMLDVSASMSPPSSDGEISLKLAYAMRAAAALAYVAMGSLERVSIFPFGDDLRPPMHAGRNRLQILGVLDYLRGLIPGGETDLIRCCRRLATQGEASGAVVVISDLLDCQEQIGDSLAHLRRLSGDLAVIQVYSPSDAAGIGGGPMLLEHAETIERMSVNVSDNLLESYRRQWRLFVAGCEKASHGCGAIFVSASTDIPFDQLILRTLREAGVLEG